MTQWLAAVAAFSSALTAFLMLVVTTRNVDTTTRSVETTRERFEASVAPYVFPQLDVQHDAIQDILAILVLLENAGTGPAHRVGITVRSTIRYPESHEPVAGWRYAHRTVRLRTARIGTLGPKEKQTLTVGVNNLRRLTNTIPIPADHLTLTVHLTYRSVTHHRYRVRKMYEYNRETNRLDIIGGDYRDRSADTRPQ